MSATIDQSELPKPAQQILSGKNPRLQAMAAKGIVPGLRPDAILSVLVALADGEEGDIKSIASRTLKALPEPILKGIAGSDLQSPCIDALANHYPDRADVAESILAMPRISIDTVCTLASLGNENVCELVATNQERLLSHPVIIEKLYLNDNTRMSTTDRIVELAVRNGVEIKGIPAWQEAARAIEGELIAEPTDEPLPEDEYFAETAELAEQLTNEEHEDAYIESDEGEEKLEDKFQPLFVRLASMSMSQKVRRAMLGTKEERMMLIREQNKVVSSAAARSPLFQEPEAVLVARNRSVSVEVLRILASTPEWMKSYMVKKNLVENSKTPVPIAMKLIGHLREADLKKLMKNKNVSAAIQLAAKRHLERRKQ